MFELHYSTGGHGGPYPSIFEARCEALRRLAGNLNERYVTIVARTLDIAVARITRVHLQQFCTLGSIVEAVAYPNDR